MLEMTFGSKKISTERPAFVMGIVNATPDSFFEGSRGGAERAMQLIEEGADILDIGGESTRPGHTPVSIEEEINRILPVIREVRRTSNIPVSIDTTKLDVFKAAFDEGADIWNDVTSLYGSGSMNADGTAGIVEGDEIGVASAKFVAQSGVSVILMHTGAASFKEASEFLEKRAEFCISNGILHEKIIVDPGIGFGKNLEQNIDLIKNCGKLCGGKFPVLMALSRKRCIGEMTGRDTQDRVTGTVSADIISVMNGAKLVRVHDVKEAVDSLNIMKFLR